MRVAMIGTGLMGAGMARSMTRAGHEVTAWNRTRAKAEPLAADGITVAASVAEAVQGADAVVTMLFDADATLAVADEIVGALGADAVWIQAGTVGVAGIAALARRSERLVDSPVLGTRTPAEEGSLVVLASGPAALLEQAAPVFEAIGSRTVHAGDEIGAASALKLACNAWIGLITAGTAQSLALAQQLGVEPRLFLEALKGGPTDTPYVHVKGKAMLAGDWSPSFAVDGVVKDTGLMIDAVADKPFPTELLTAVRSLFERAADAGHGADDMAAVWTAF